MSEDSESIGLIEDGDTGEVVGSVERVRRVRSGTTFEGFRWRCARCRLASPVHPDTASAAQGLLEHRNQPGACNEPKDTGPMRSEDDCTILLADQMADLMPYVGDVATTLLGDALPSMRLRVLRRAVERFEEGYEEYGDDLFAKSYDEVEDEFVDELADAVIYGARMMSLKHARRDGA